MSYGLIGNASFAISQWLVVVVIAQWTSPTDLGRYSLAVVLTTPVVVATNLQLRNLVATGATPHHGFRQHLSVRVGTMPIDFAVVTVLLVVGPWGSSTALIVFALLLAKEFEAVSDLMYGYTLRAGDVSAMARSLLLRGFLGLASFSLALRATRSIASSLLILALVWCAVALAHDVRTGMRHAGQSDPPMSRGLGIGEILRQGAPLGLASLIVVVGVSIPRLFIERWVGTDGLGVYTALTFVITGGAIVVNSVCQILLPRLAEQYVNDDKSAFRASFRRLIVGAGIFGCLLVVLALLGGHIFLGAVYGSVYASYDELLIWLMIAGFVTYLASVVGWALIATRRIRGQLVTVASGSCAIITASALLIPANGLSGAAWAVTSGMGLQAVVGWIVLSRSSQARFQTGGPMTVKNPSVRPSPSNV